MQNLYLEVDSLKPAALFVAGVEEIAREAPDALWVPATADVPDALMVGRRVLLLKPADLVRLEDLPTAFARVFAFYLQSREIEMEDVQIEYAAIRGMLSRLDRPTRLLVDNRLDDFRIRSRGSLSGIGCRLGMRQDEPTVIQVIEGSPSAAMGLLEGDRVIRIEGESTTNMPLSEVVSRLRGPSGTVVQLEVRRGQDGQVLSFQIQRDRIKLENVEAYRLTGDIGYVSISNFSDETLSNFRSRLERIAPGGHGLRGLVIDLRQNGGGSLKQSAYMVDEFVESGNIVKTQGRPSQDVQDLVRAIDAQAPQILKDVPVAVLVDRRTASGAEILAGALKYLDRAILIGQRTYGKGSVQKVYPLNDHASLKMTVARYLLPGEHYIQTIGLQPDISLIPLVSEAGNIRFRYPAELPDEEDGDTRSSPTAPPSVGREETLSTVYYVDRGTRAADERPREERLWEDFEVRFAAELLASASGATRNALITNGSAYVERIKAEQSAALIAVLKERGLDWHAALSDPLAKAQVRLKVSPQEPATSGQDSTLTLEVTNEGTGPFSRLRAVSSSSDSLLDGLEFLFGRIEPGETRIWPVKISIPAGVAAGTRSLTFHFTSDGIRVAEPFETGLGLLDGGSPLLEMEATYEDRGAEGQPGTGNRVVEAGEQVAIRLWIRNVGEAPTGQLGISLRNPLRKGIELRDARLMIEPIPPGEQREATLTFDVKSLAPGDQPLQLALQVVDRTHRIRLTRELEFGHPWSGRLQIVPPRFQLSSPVPTGTMAERTLTLAGQVSDAQGIRRVTIYRDQTKIQRILPGLQAEQPVTVLPFRTEILLEPGANAIEVVSEDEAGLTTSKLMWVRVAGS